MSQTAAMPPLQSHFFSRQEPLLFFNFDLNPNTSVFSLTFLVATLFQISGFYLFRRFVPELAIRKRRLSWVLTLFSSLVLFTGTFTLSSGMEWSLNHHGVRDPHRTGGLSEKSRTQAWSWQPPLSLRAFPRESSVATMYSAYFVSYLICDLVLGMIHYRAHIDPLSGWCHHLGYLVVVSNATMQKNVSTLFAMGTPIEGKHRRFLSLLFHMSFLFLRAPFIHSYFFPHHKVSTIFLASGHIFPKLRSDFLFATSFFLIRIVYPVVLLPELFLNVDSRLCWKVGLMALMVHVHWFKKFVQQQLRYYRARHVPLTENVHPLTTHNVQTESPFAKISTTTTTIEHLQPPQALPKVNPMAKPVGIVFEYSSTTVSAKTDKALNVSEGQNVMAETLQPQDEKAVETGVQTPQTNHGSATKLAQVVTARKTCTRPSLPDTMMEATSPTKTMEQLLEECAGEDEDTFVRNWPILSRDKSRANKTFSAVAMKRLLASQGKGQAIQGQGAVDGVSAVALGGQEGVGAMAGISRASSMRDSKRRIGLDSVRFEQPVVVREGKETQQSPPQHQYGSTRLRSRRSLLSEDQMNQSDALQIGNRELDFETIRVSRRGVVAVNA